MIAAATLIAALTAPAAAQDRDRTARTISESFAVEGSRIVVFKIDVGEVEVTGTDGDSVEARIVVRCNRRRDRARCVERAEDLELTSYRRRGSLVLEVDGTGWWRSRDTHVDVMLGVPRNLAFEVELGTGELTVENLLGGVTVGMSIGEATLRNVSGEVFVDVGIGEVTVTMSQDTVGEVTLDNGLGETELRHRDGRNAMEGILGGTDVRWHGPGPHTVKVELNIGEISVRLQ